MINELLLNKKIEYGTIEITGASNQWGWTSITFQKKYSSAPKVFIQEYSNSFAPISTTIINLTTTGCNVGIWNNANKHKYYYLVIGE